MIRGGRKSRRSPRAIATTTFVAVLAAATAASLDAHAHRHERAFSAPVSSAEGDAVVVLRAPESPRVFVPRSDFTMGSSQPEMVAALEMCRGEPLGFECAYPVIFRPQREGLAHRVSLSAYEIDRTEVTVAAYSRCESATACGRALYPRGDARFDHPDFPVTFVTWEDARAYCSFVSGRLPTEAEWEHAARGAARRVFPWGNLYNAHIPNHGSLGAIETSGVDGYENLAPVGAMQDDRTPTGVRDLGGNVAEYVSDLFDESEVGWGFEPDPVVDPKGPKTGVGPVIRGGSYRSGAFTTRGAYRRPAEYARAPDIGFRCAYDVTN